MVPGYLQLATVLVLSILGSSIAFIESSCEHSQFCGRRSDSFFGRFDDSERYPRLGDRHRFVERLEFDDRRRELSNFNHNELRAQANRFDIEKVWREERRSANSDRSDLSRRILSEKLERNSRDSGDRFNRDSSKDRRDLRLKRKREDHTNNDRRIFINSNRIQGSKAGKLERSSRSSFIRDVDRIQSASSEISDQRSKIRHYTEIRTTRHERREVENYRSTNNLLERSESLELNSERSALQNRYFEVNTRTHDRAAARIQRIERRDRQFSSDGQERNRMEATEPRERRERFERLAHRNNDRTAERRHDAFITEERRNQEVRTDFEANPLHRDAPSEFSLNRRRTETPERITEVELHGKVQYRVPVIRRESSEALGIRTRENRENRIFSTTLNTIERRFRQRREESEVRDDENADEVDVKNNRRTERTDRRQSEDRSRLDRTELKHNIRVEARNRRKPEHTENIALINRNVVRRYRLAGVRESNERKQNNRELISSLKRNDRMHRTELSERHNSHSIQNGNQLQRSELLNRIKRVDRNDRVPEIFKERSGLRQIESSIRSRNIPDSTERVIINSNRKEEGNDWNEDQKSQRLFRTVLSRSERTDRISASHEFERRQERTDYMIRDYHDTITRIASRADSSVEERKHRVDRKESGRNALENAIRNAQDLARSLEVNGLSIRNYHEKRAHNDIRMSRNGEERKHRLDRTDHSIVQEVRRATERNDLMRNEQAMRIRREQIRHSDVEFRGNFARNIPENSEDQRLIREYASANEDAIFYTDAPTNFNSLYQLIQTILVGSIILSMLKRQEISGGKIRKNWAFDKFAVLKRCGHVF